MILFLILEVCVCCSRAVFPSLIYLQTLSALRPTTSSFLCQGTLQLNFFQILFFLDIVTKMCCRKILNKDRVVSKHVILPKAVGSECFHRTAATHFSWLMAK